MSNLSIELRNKYVEYILNIFSEIYNEMLPNKTDYVTVEEDIITSEIVEKFNEKSNHNPKAFKGVETWDKNYVRKGITDINLYFILGTEIQEFMTFECKRLCNSYNNYNEYYIKRGVSRFKEKYKTPNNIAGMVGFIQDKGNIRITEIKYTIENNKDVFINSNFVRTPIPYVNNINLYITTHNNTDDIKIYHIFYDFT